MILNAAKRFLLSELESIEAGLDWIDADINPALAGEYERRYQIVCDLIDSATTPQAAIRAIEQRIADADMLLAELTHTSGKDPMREALLIDIDYLAGLRQRLNQTVLDSTVTYALANVQRL